MIRRNISLFRQEADGRLGLSTSEMITLSIKIHFRQHIARPMGYDFAQSHFNFC